MWKRISSSVAGTSHATSNTPCQDSSLVSPLSTEHQQFLVAVCSDGAGSAAHSDVGSALACDAAVRLLADAAGDGSSAPTEEQLRSVATGVREELLRRADEMGVAPRELACTLLAALIGETWSAFLQIGDGIIVRWSSDAYELVFWPQSGEYQNTTFFLTGEDYAKRLDVSVATSRCDEIALSTDGLQMLALNYAGKSVHQPFFRPLFKALRAAEMADELIVPLKQFLNSRAVNDRTDDDKTLVLASRRGA